MKKLLYTTAIAGLAMTYATVSSAETKISGNLGLSYFMSSDDFATVASRTSLNGFGKESQINIANSGELSNGMGYAAGFSFEFDGADSQADGQTAENIYIDFKAGDTTISIGSDHFQNTDKHMTNLVGFGYIGADGASQNAASIYPTSATSNYAAYGVGLLQKTEIGSFGINFTPNRTNNTSANDIGNALTKAKAGDGAAGSATEITFSGNLGGEGLNVLAGTLFNDKDNGKTRDGDGHRVAASYTAGGVTVAVDTVESSNGTDEFTGKSVGVAFAASDALSIGVTLAEADSTASSSKDEETKMIAIGYNLGPVSVQAQYKDVENLGGTNGNDGTLFGVYLGTKF